MPYFSRFIVVTTGLIVAGLFVQIQGSAQDQTRVASIIASAALAQIEAPEAPSKESPLLKEPESADEVFDAVMLFTDFGQMEQAKGYLEQLVKMSLSDDELLAIRDEQGTAALLRLANTKELQPASTEFLKLVTAASRKKATDPAVIDAVISDLFAGPTKERIAQIEIKNIGLPAIPRLLTRLSQTDDRTESEKLLFAITQMGDTISPAIIGALETPDEKLRGALINILGWIKAEDAIPDLQYFAFSATQPPGTQMSARRSLARVKFGDEKFVKKVSGYGTADDLKKVALGYFSQKKTIATVNTPDANNQKVDIWVWDPSAGTVVPINTSTAAAANYHAVKQAKRALSFAPTREELQTLYLATIMADEAHRKGWERPVRFGPGTPFNLAITSGQTRVLESLHLAMEHGQTGAATVLLSALREIATHHALHDVGDHKSPLLQALNYPDPRVQFAAARVVLTVNPKRSFPGSTRIVQILSQALNDHGKGQALIIDPNSLRAGTLAATLNQIGYSATIAKTGRDGFRVASSRGDMDLVVMHVNSIQWELTPTITNFRADSRTSFVPIAISGPESLRATKQRLIDGHHSVAYLPETTSAPILETYLQPFVSSLTAPPLTAAQRAERKQRAMQMLAKIATGQTQIKYDISKVEDAVANSLIDNQLADAALEVLGMIPTATAQSHITEPLLAPVTPEARKMVAAWELGNHIKRFGLLLDAATVKRIEDLWNQGSNSPELQTALGAIVGTLKPSPEWTSQQLQQYQPAPIPAPN